MRLWALLTGTAVAVAVFVAVLAMLGTNDRGVSGFTRVDNRNLFPGLDSRLDQVSAIEIQSSDPPLTLEKGKDEWRLAQHHGHPAQDAKVENLLQTLVALRADYVSEDRSATEGSGIENPQQPSSQAARVRLLSPQRDVVAGAIIGHEVTVPGDLDHPRMLVRRDPGKRTWLATPAVRVETSARDWLKRDIVDIPRERVARLEIMPRDGNRLALQRSDRRGLHVAEGIAGDDMAGQPQLEAVAGALERLQFDDARPLQTILDRSQDEGRTVVATRDGPDYTIRWLSEKDRGLIWATFSAKQEGSQAKEPSPEVRRFNARHETWAYKLPAPVVRYLRVRAVDLGYSQGTGSGGAPNR